MKTDNQDHTVIALPWFNANEWDEFRKFCQDGNEWEASYREWLQNAEKAMRELNAEGVHVEKVTVSLRDFKRWCQKHGKPPVSHSRSEFAVMELQKRGA